MPETRQAQSGSRKISCWGNSLPPTQVSYVHASDSIKLGVSKVRSVFSNFYHFLIGHENVVKEKSIMHNGGTLV